MIKDESATTGAIEQNVIGGILLNSEAIDEVLSILDPSDFYYTPTREVFQAIKELHDNNEIIDVFSIQDRLEGKITRDTMNEWIYQFSDDPTTNAVAEAKVLKRQADRRRLQEVGKMIIDNVNSREPNEILADVDNWLTMITPLIDKDRKIDLKSQKEDVLNELNAIDDFKQSKYFAGFKFKAGDVILLKGRTGHGKTAVALNITGEMLNGMGGLKPLSVYYFTFEQERKEIITWIANIMGMSVETLIDTRGEYLNVLYGVHKIVDIEAYVRNWTRTRGKLDLVVIDYDTFLDPTGQYETEERRVNAISKALKNIAVRYNTSILLLSQVSDDGKAKWGRVKEEDASVVINIELTPEQEELLTSKEDWQITLRVQKSRNGEFGSGVLTFDRQTRKIKKTPEVEI